MKKNFKEAPKQKEKCYYVDFDICTCGSSANRDSRCVGREACEYFVGENDFFLQMMNGKEELKQGDEQVKEREARIKKNLSLGKSKKQLKREQKLEDEKNGVGQGYNVFGDDRFADLFKSVGKKQD